ncbi:non-specific serine/threonine protein kinase [Trifolium repens]|nr:non-specific serine/threonine protein kinase [Trifolium repens]
MDVYTATITFCYSYANEMTLGCERNYSKAECRNEKDSAAFYNMVSMSNIVWKDNPYFEDEHMDDCNCWAALYKNGTCTKQGMPLRYVKRTHEADNSTTTFLKIGKNSIQSSKGYENPFGNPLPIKTTREVNKLVPWEVIDKVVMENMVKRELLTDIAIPPCPVPNSA